MSDIRCLHKNDEDIPLYYRNMSLHIAIENADIKKDWENFRKLYKFAPKYLKNHLNMTEVLFDYNYNQLTPKEKHELFN
jgi:hypothetical protein